MRGIHQKIKVTIIGSGRVATHLAHAFHDNDVPVGEIFSRSLDRAKELSAHIPNSSATDSLDFAQSESKIFLLAIKDDAISRAVNKIKLPPGSTLFHTSGTVSMNVMANNIEYFGVFYPLQTFASNRDIDFKRIPILIEANHPSALNQARELAKLVSQTVQEVKEAERQQLHVAAVFASNFTNRMLAAAKEILAETSLHKKILQPLVEQSIANVFEVGADQALTGPARRNDQTTIAKHLKLLESQPELADIYQRITHMIITKYRE
ncbi:MAG: DUF2520 domain-containing protein [Reichenbachiella sp.]|uniref:Rossmann-like and DUF2520 domain-containing protein n=1 Tax=Reichenbachiella sp. TaxID=2184521 RepID=UPI0032634C85